MNKKQQPLQHTSNRWSRFKATKEECLFSRFETQQGWLVEVEVEEEAVWFLFREHGSKLLLLSSRPFSSI